MQFNEYKTLRNQFLSQNADKYPRLKHSQRHIKALNSAEWRHHWMNKARTEKVESDLDIETVAAALGEDFWVDEERPFYNVWPIAVELAKNVTLSLPFSAVEISFQAMLLRFARGHEPYGITVAMLQWPRDLSYIHIYCYLGVEWHRVSLRYPYELERPVEDFLDMALSEDEEESDVTDNSSELADLLIRLSVLVGLLVNDQDMRKKGTGVLFRCGICLARSSAWANGPFEPQFRDGLFAPCFTAIRSASLNGPTQRIQFGLRLDTVDAASPVARSRDWPIGQERPDLLVAAIIPPRT